MTEPAQPGGGKYDDLLNFAMLATGARSVLIVVEGGARGSGFAVGTKGGPTNEATLVEVLRDVANQIEAGLRAHRQKGH